MVALSPNIVPDGVIRDKQLKTVDVLAALFKWRHNIGVNLKELAVVNGQDYSRVRGWGVPLFDGKITRREFEAWKRQKKKEAQRGPLKDGEREQRGDRQSGPATAARQRRSTADKSDGSLRQHGSPASSRSRQELVETAGSTK